MYYYKDIAWVQLDVADEDVKVLNGLLLEEQFFYNRNNVMSPPSKHVSKYEITKLNNLMFSIGFKLVRVEDMGVFDRLLYVWNEEFYFPIKEVHHVASFLIKDVKINMRGLAHSGSNWLHMLIGDGGKVLEDTLSLQNELPNGTYVMHDMKKKEMLVRIKVFLTQKDRDVLITYDKFFYGLFRTVDYVLTVLRFV